MSPPLNGLSLWLKANPSVARDSNNFVDKWADQSGNGFNAAQSAQANKPVFVQNAINGMPAIQFDGIDDLFTAAGVTGNYSNCTIFTVMKPAALADYNQSMGASGAWGQFNFHSSANGTVYAGTDTNTRFVTAANTMVNNQVQQFTYRLSDGSAALYKNGAAIAGGTQTNLSNRALFAVSSFPIHYFTELARNRKEKLPANNIYYFKTSHPSMFVEDIQNFS